MNHGLHLRHRLRHAAAAARYTTHVDKPPGSKESPVTKHNRIER